MAKKKQKEKGIAYFDYNLLFLVIFLLCFGLVMLYSSSSYTSFNKYGDSAFYLKKQIRNILFGTVCMIVMMSIDYRIWKKLSIWVFFISVILCGILLVPGMGLSSHGSSRWIGLGPIQFQPSEIAKIAVIMFFAAILERVPNRLNRMKDLVKVCIPIIPLIGMVAYSNLSTGIIILGIVFAMLFVASPRYVQFIILGVVAVIGIVIFIATAGYRGTRVQTWLNPEAAGNDGYQTMMGLYAIGSGGLFGKGLGESLQKLGNVPESQNDMIFTIICEELGLFGAICLILLFLLLIWRMMIIANNAADLYGALVVTGVMAHISLQVLLNIAVVTNAIPNTGVILPFISYGGTSIMFLMGEMGLVLSVSKGIKLETF